MRANFFARHTVCTCPVLAPNARQSTCDVVPSVTCSGLDYVSHDDVLPYTNTSSDVFQHELFGQFFTPTLSQTSEEISPSPLSLLAHTHTHTHTYTHSITHCKMCILLVVASSRPFLSTLQMYIIHKAQYALLFPTHPYPYPTPTPLPPHSYPTLTPLLPHSYPTPTPPRPHSSEDPFVSPRDVLFNWRDQNKQCLALTDVHIETSGGIRVTVMPFYMGCRVRGGEGRNGG